jgi:hypothetical protein
MHFSVIIWLALFFVALIVLVALVVRARRRQPGEQPKSVKSAWLAGAATSGFLLICVAAKVARLEQAATTIDIAALAILGMLTGVCLVLGIVKK